VVSVAAEVAVAALPSILIPVSVCTALARFNAIEVVPIK
jgi:hypothetical protein